MTLGEIRTATWKLRVVYSDRYNNFHLYAYRPTPVVNFRTVISC